MFNSVNNRAKNNGYGSEEVKLAYQPNYPLESKLHHVYVMPSNEGGGVYLCESPQGSEGYAPGCVFDEDNAIK